MRIIGNDKARFDSHFTCSKESGCWLWTAALDGHDYGHFWFRGEIMKAHRVSWVLHKGEIPEGKWVLHRCDTPRCVNPEHLFIGDRTANMQDMAAKGRQVFQVSPEKIARCEKSVKAKLTNDQTREIKRLLADGVSLSRLAKLYGVCKSTVSHIRTGRNWKYLDVMPRAEIEIEQIIEQGSLL